MRRECRCNVFPTRQLQRKPLVNDPDMHHGTCVTHVPWYMSGSLTCGGGESVPGIPGTCGAALLRMWQETHAVKSLKLIWKSGTSSWKLSVPNDWVAVTWLKDMSPGPLFTKKTPSYQYRDSHYKPETSSDRLRFITGIPIPVRRRLLSEERPRIVVQLVNTGFKTGGKISSCNGLFHDGANLLP